MSDPRRLLDSDMLDGSQRRVLEDAKDVDPPAGAEDAVWAKIAAITGGGGGGSGGGSGGGGAIGKAVVAGGAAVVAVGVAVIVATRTPPAADVPAPVTPSASASVVLTERAPPMRDSVGSDAASNVPTRSVDDLPQARPTAVAVAPSSSAGEEDALLAESRLVKSARQALAAGDAAAALRDLQAAERRYPSGALVQEREVLTIEALAAENRTGEAEARARAFLAAHPESPFVKRVSAHVRR